MYTLSEDNAVVIRDADGAHIPVDPANTDYAAYLAWVAEGNAATPYIAPIPSAQTLADAIDSQVAAVYSNWTRFQQEYLMRQQAAQAFKDSSYAGDPGVWVTAFATSAGLTNQQAADLILAQSVSLNAALATLGALRMRKYEVINAASPEAAKAAYDDITAKINAVAASLA